MNALLENIYEKIILDFGGKLCLCICKYGFFSDFIPMCIAVYFYIIHNCFGEKKIHSQTRQTTVYKKCVFFQ